MIELEETKTKRGDTFIGDSSLHAQNDGAGTGRDGTGSASSATYGTLHAQHDGAGMGKRAFPPIGNEVEYRGLTFHQLASKLGLTDQELYDVLDEKRSYKPMVYIEGVDPMSIANNMMPFEPTHPGDVLKEEIEYRELDLHQLAYDMGITLQELTEILDCKRPVTQDYAKRFEKTLELDAEPLVSMQHHYDIEAVLIPLRSIRRAQKEKGKKYKQILMERARHHSHLQRKRKSFVQLTPTFANKHKQKVYA
jgi:addiction module HigA family antidote